MKVILRALEENLTTPQPRWWGLKKGNIQCLMRYGEFILVWDTETKKVLRKDVCTKTDKAGVKFAINHLGLIDISGS